MHCHAMGSDKCHVIPIRTPETVALPYARHADSEIYRSQPLAICAADQVRFLATMMVFPATCCG